MALVTALLALDAPPAEVAASADSQLALMPRESQGANLVGFATELTRHPHTEALAPRYAARGLELLPPGAESAGLRSLGEMVLAVDYTNRSLPDSAIGRWLRALPDRPDSQMVLAQLGSACVQAHREPEAIGYWIRAAAVFGAADTSFAGPLRDLYRKRNRSLRGLDTAIAAARAVSRQRVALDPLRVDEVAPDWTLKDLEGKSVSLGALKGRIVVLDFWGSWCGPCRRELPHFEQLYGRYRGDKVAFLSVNVEMERTVEAHLEKARAFIAQNHYSFPVLPDHDGVAVNAHGISSYPTLLLIGPDGRIRYRNIGYREGFDEIIAAQLADLMK
jgi:thiol-disulfide isomerase/thioredoxin